MREHDIMQTDGTSVLCRCGRRFDWDTVEESRARQAAHRGVEMSRDALNGPSCPLCSWRGHELAVTAHLAKEHHT